VLPIAVVLSLGVSPSGPSGPAAGGVLPRLVRALDDPDPDVRANLAAALVRIGPTAVEPLTAALTDPSPDRRAGAAYALGLMGASARSALPALLDRLKDDDVGVRRQASFAVARLVPAGRPAAQTARTGGEK
jgi:HEAT repeat protein